MSSQLLSHAKREAIFFFAKLCIANVAKWQNQNKPKGNQGKKEIFTEKFKQKGSDNKRKEHTKKENLVKWILLKRTTDTVRS
jgi:hypothetical protein